MMLLWILLVLAAFAVFRKLFLEQWSRNLDFRVSFARESVYAGDTTELFEQISNRKKLPVPMVEAAFRLEKGILFRNTENIIISDYNYKRDLFALRGMEQVTRTYQLECLKRGCYTVSQSALLSYSAFDRGKRLREYEIESLLYVYPERTDVTGILRAVDAIMGEIPSRRKYLEDPFSFASIREYTMQDPMKSINWKASARMGKLMVNTFSSVQSEEVLVFLDVEDSRILKEEEAVEKGISIAASLCSMLLRRGFEAGLFVNTDPVTVFLPKKGTSRQGEIERFLTGDFAHGRTMRFADMLESIDFPENRVCVLISKELERGKKIAARDFSDGGLTAVCVAPKGPGTDREYEVWPLGRG